jgi:hypothetical protein
MPAAASESAIEDANAIPAVSMPLRVPLASGEQGPRVGFNPRLRTYRCVAANRRFVPILLKKSVIGVGPIFSGSLARFLSRDAEDLIGGVEATWIVLNGIAKPSIVDFRCRLDLS